MAVPLITDFILYVATPLTDTDWAFNWGEVVKYVGDGTFDFTINSLTTTAGATFGSDVGVTGTVTATAFVGDGSGITNASGFVNRGDPSAVDKNNFTTDGTWRDWDLSSIVTDAGALAVLLHITAMDNAEGSTFRMRKNGNSNAIAINSIITHLNYTGGNWLTSATFIVPLDANRVVEYMGDNLTFDLLTATVLGWWK